MSGMADTAGEDLSRARQYAVSTEYHLAHAVDLVVADLLDLWVVLTL